MESLSTSLCLHLGSAQLSSVQLRFVRGLISAASVEKFQLLCYRFVIDDMMDGLPSILHLLLRYYLTKFAFSFCLCFCFCIFLFQIFNHNKVFIFTFFTFKYCFIVCGFIGFAEMLLCVEDNWNWYIYLIYYISNNNNYVCVAPMGVDRNAFGFYLNQIFYYCS